MTPTEITQRAGPVIIDDILYGQDAIVAAWVHAKLGFEAPVGVPFKAFAIMPPSDEACAKVIEQINAGEPPDFWGGAYFHSHYEGLDMTVTVVADDTRAGHPKVIRKILEYPFGEKDLPRISAIIHASNTRCLEAAITLGFEHEGNKRGTDLQYWGLERSKCAIWNRYGPYVAPQQ